MKKAVDNNSILPIYQNRDISTLVFTSQRVVVGVLIRSIHSNQYDIMKIKLTEWKAEQLFCL